MNGQVRSPDLARGLSRDCRSAGGNWRIADRSAGLGSRGILNRRDGLGRSSSLDRRSWGNRDNRTRLDLLGWSNGNNRRRLGRLSQLVVVRNVVPVRRVEGGIRRLSHADDGGSDV